MKADMFCTNCIKLLIQTSTIKKKSINSSSSRMRVIYHNLINLKLIMAGNDLNILLLNRKINS